MPTLRYTAAALRDLVEIAVRIAETSGSSVTAERFVGKLREKCRKLADLPGLIGRARPELLADVRSSPFGNYVIFFRYADDIFEVLAIVERHRDVDAVFGDHQPD